MKTATKWFSFLLATLIMISFVASCSTETNNKISIPDIIDTDEESAKTILSANGLVPIIQHEHSSQTKKGNVINTDPAVGSFVDKNSKVIVYICDGKSDVATTTTPVTSSTKVDEQGTTSSATDSSSTTVKEDEKMETTTVATTTTKTTKTTASTQKETTGTFKKDTSASQNNSVTTNTFTSIFTIATTKTPTNTKKNTTTPITANPTTPTTASQEQLHAIKAAEEIANTYATISPRQVKRMLVKEKGFSKSQALYAVTYANIDWTLFALSHLNEYIIINEGTTLTEREVESYLSEQLGYSSAAVKYALDNTNAHLSTATNQIAYDSIVGIYRYDYFENGNSWYRVFEFTDDGSVYFTDFAESETAKGPYTVEGSWIQTRNWVDFSLNKTWFEDYNLLFEFTFDRCTITNEGILYNYEQYRKIA